MSPDWLNVVAVLALLVPTWLQLSDGLIAVLEKAFDLLGHAIESVVLDVCDLAISALNCMLDIFSSLPLLEVLPDPLDFLKRYIMSNI